MQVNAFASAESFRFYSTLLERLQSAYPSGSALALVGLEANARDMFFERLIVGADCARACAAAGVVALLIWLYARRSLRLTLFIVVGMLLCVGVALFGYAIVLDIRFFPFINALAVLIALAVGVDDAFVLMHQYERTKQVGGRPATPLWL